MRRRDAAPNTPRTETGQAEVRRVVDPNSGTGRLQKESMNEQLQLSEEMSAETARLRVDVYGSQPREHVLEDLNFLNYRLADVRISPEVTLSEPDIVLDQDGRQGDRLRRPDDDVPGPVAGRPDPEGRRGDARPAHGGEGPAPVPCLGGALSRQDRDVPRRRVEPRQEHGPDRGLPARRAAGVDRDHRRRRRRARGQGLQGAVHQEAHRGHRAGRQGRPRSGRRQVLRRDADLGALHGAEQRRRRRRARDRRQLRSEPRPR